MQYAKRCRSPTRKLCSLSTTVRCRAIPTRSSISSLRNASRRRIFSSAAWRTFPGAVRRIYEAGHSIGTHSEDHPSRFQNLPVEKVRQEIDEGIADVGAALGDPKELAPFFRIPGLARSDSVEEELAARSLVVFSSDTVADDWYRRIKPSEIIRRAMSRLEARGKGILLLHDIHRRTVAALPGLLKELKEQGFHVVHVIPGERPGRIETAGEPAPSTAKSMTPWTGDWSDPNWPTIVAGPTPDRIVLAAPEANSFATDYRPWRTIMLADGAAGAGLLAAAADTQWPDSSGAALPSTAAELPAPSLQDIGFPLQGLRLVDQTLGLRSNLATTDFERDRHRPCHPVADRTQRKRRQRRSMKFHLCRRREIDIFRRTSALLAETTDTTTDEPPGPSTRFRHPVPRARSQTPFRRPTKPRAAAKLPKIRDVPRRAKAQPSPCVWPPPLSAAHRVPHTVKPQQAANTRSQTAKPLHTTLARRAVVRLDTMAAAHPRPLAVPHPELPWLCSARLPHYPLQAILRQVLACSSRAAR